MVGHITANTRRRLRCVPKPEIRSEDLQVLQVLQNAIAFYYVSRWFPSLKYMRISNSELLHIHHKTTDLLNSMVVRYVFNKELQFLRAHNRISNSRLLNARERIQLVRSIRPPRYDEALKRSSPCAMAFYQALEKAQRTTQLEMNAIEVLSQLS